MKVWSKVRAGFVPAIAPVDDKGDKGLIGIVLLGTQVFTALAPFLPLIKLTLETGIKFLKSATFSRILFKMQTFKNRNCKLRYMAFATADEIITLLQQKPGGSSFWRLLPQKGRSNKEAVRKKIAETLLHAFYDDNFISILLKGALDEKGKPRSDGTLYHWLLTNVYSDNVQQLYNDWLRVGKKQDCDV